MRSASPPPPPPPPSPPPPPPVHTDTRVVEPDEQWKADLRKRIEHDLLHMVSDAQIARDTTLNSQPSKSSRERAHWDYEKSLNNIRTLAQEEFTRQLRQEISERKWALDVVLSNSPDVARQQQWILDNTGPVQFPRRGIVNSTGSTSSGAGLHHAGSINSDQYRSSSVAPHGGSERPSTQSRDRIASNINIGSRERQTSASASPHDRPSPPTFPTAPRAIPGARPSLDEALRFPTSASPGGRPIYAMQRSPEDMRQGMPIPRGPTTPEEARGMSWGSLFSRRSLDDFNVHRRHNSKGEQRLTPIDGDLSDASDDVVGQLDDRQSVRSAMSIEQLAAWETEARRKEEEANRKEEEASKKEEEARRLEEKARQSLEEARRLETCARQADASAKIREAAAQSKEAEAKHKEAEAKKREAAAQKREAKAQRKEEDARHRELQARRKEEQAQRKEDDACKREEEVRKKEDDARKREDDARRREEDARQREMLARQKEEDAPRLEEDARKKEEEARRKEDEARLKEEEARRIKEAKRIEEDYQRKKREIERREAELKKREEEILLKENAARLAQEEAKKREVTAQKREAEAQRKEEDTQSALQKATSRTADTNERYQRACERIGEYETKLAEVRAELEKKKSELEAVHLQLTDQLGQKCALLEQAEANAAEAKKRAGLEQRELQAKLDVLMLSRDEHLRTLKQTQSALQKATSRAADADERSQPETELAEVRAELEGKKSELEAVRLRLTDAEVRCAKSKAEADTLRAQTAPGLVNTDVDRFMHRLMERMRTMEAEIASLRGDEKSIEEMECRNEG